MKRKVRISESESERDDRFVRQKDNKQNVILPTISISNSDRRLHKPSPIVAWPERDNASNPSVTLKRRAAEQPQSRSAKQASVPASLDLFSVQLSSLVHISNSDELVARAKVFDSAENMIDNLPLKYVYSKAELREYAIRRAARSLIKPALASIKIVLKEVFRRWLTPTEIHLNDKQIGFMVIAKRLSVLLLSAQRKKFKYWATVHSSRFNKIRGRRPNAAAVLIQRWFRHMRQIRSQPFRSLTEAVHYCLHRRRAIKKSIEFEATRRKALDKVRRAVALRRRLFFAARSIQRVYRWVMLLRRVSWRLTRSKAAAKIKKWRKHILAKRSAYHLIIIRLVLRCGGMKLVRPKVPERFIVGNKGSFLESVNDCVRQIQRAWFRSCNNFAAFMQLAAQRAKEAFEKMLNDMATFIQNNYRAHLWQKLLLAAYQNNRVRRIQRAFRAYQYRCWVAAGVLRGRHRRATKIKQFIARRRNRQILHNRFVIRKSLLIFTKARRGSAARKIQRRFRRFIVKMREYREELKRIYEEQKKKHGFMINHTITIQRFFRQFWTPEKFPRHVLRIAERVALEHRRLLNRMAHRIQKLGRNYNAAMAAILLQLQTRKAMIIWKLAKAYILKLALYDRVMATRERKRRASNRMKKNFRWALLMRSLNTRFALTRERIRLYRMKETNITVIQMFCRRKLFEYNAALRVAGRRQLYKKRKAEAEERERQRINRAASKVQAHFHSIVHWSRNLRRINEERIYYRRHNATKKIQKFFKMVLAWARFNRAVEEKNARIAAEKRRQLEIKASNMVGWYWRRHKEKSTLNNRFELRKKMLDTYKALEAARIAAYEKRDEALHEVKITEESLESTIAASWKQGSDSTGRNYYYNFVTGESQWDPPENWRMKVADQWIRNVDDRLNVYYYNQTTGESRWLPPCTICGEEAARWCADCSVAYCENDFDFHHQEGNGKGFENHAWSLTEYVKDILMPGEIYCIECKRRSAKRTCTTCWDSYCDECFKFVHHIGALKSHRYISYKKAKKGWMCIKSKVPGEPDYYINGATGLTTFDKPKELMTDQELIYYENFETHKDALEQNLKKIEKLQVDLEAVTYDRDTILYDALSGGGGGGGAHRKKAKSGASDGASVVAAANKKGQGGIMAMFSGITDAYRGQLLNPSNRVRGKERSDYIDNLLASNSGSPTKK